jgi:hypothetical protein
MEQTILAKIQMENKPKELKREDAENNPMYIYIYIYI